VSGKGADHAEEPQVDATGMMTGGLVSDLPTVSNMHSHVAEVLVAVDARWTVSTRRKKAGNDVISGLQGGNARADLLDDTSPFVTADHWTQEWHVTGQEVLVRVTQSRGDKTCENLLVFGRVELNWSDLPYAARLPQHSGFGLQSSLPFLSALVLSVGVGASNPETGSLSQTCSTIF
jgi:hypothetical protein